MRTLKNFEYIIADSVEQVASLLEQHGDDAKLIAGGTDLIGLLKDRVLTPKYLISIHNIPSLNYIEYNEDEGLTIGAATTIAELNQSELIKEKFLAIYDATEAFGNTQIRNIATVAGNIGSSTPYADMATILIALGAEVKIVGVKGERIVALDEFFTGPGKNILHHEIITEIRIPAEKRPYSAGFEKIAKTAEDFAKANCAVKIVVKDGKCDDIRVAFGGGGPTPLRGKNVEERLKGKALTERVIEEAAAKTPEDISPITDIRSNADYRNHICKVMVKRLINKAISGR